MSQPADNIYVQLLRVAKRELEKPQGQRREHCVCRALWFVASPELFGRDDHPAAERITLWVKKCINRRCYVNEWLGMDAGIPWRQLTYENLRQYRIRWIDHMIEIWKDVEVPPEHLPKSRPQASVSSE